MIKDFQDKTEKELIKQLAEARKDVRKFRFSLSGSNKKSIKEIRDTRKKIARILTELNERKLKKEDK